jgi:hypothetical protein
MLRSLCCQSFHRIRDARNLCVYVRMFASHQCRRYICNSSCNVAIRWRAARLQKEVLANIQYKTSRGFHPRSLDSESRMLSVTPRSPMLTERTLRVARGEAYAIMTSETERWLRGGRYNETTAVLSKRQRELQDRLVQPYCFEVPLSHSTCCRGVIDYYEQNARARIATPLEALR